MGTKRDILDEVAPKMERAIEHFKTQLSEVRAGRATPNVLNSVMVESYGSTMPINQVSSVSTPDARTILVQPWDKQQIGAIETAIINANIGLTPVNTGDVLRLNIPPLTEERRELLVKQIKADAENARISMRGARRDAIDAIRKSVKDDGLPEDVAYDGETEAQKILDEYTDKIEAFLVAKEKEIMTV